MSFLITSKKEITEFELTYFVKMNSIDLKKDIYNFINRGFGNEEEINNASPRRVVIVNSKAFPFEYPPSPEDVIWMDLEATKSSKIIDKLLANNGFLIIINCGENFITAYMKKYMGSDYYFIESLEDEYENEALEESANLRAIKKIYGSVMKYYIFMKKR